MTDYIPTGGSPPTADASGLLDRILSEVEATSSPPSAAAPPPPSPSTGDPGALGGLLSNPALLSAIPTLLGNLAPLMSGGGGNGGGGSPPPSEHGGSPPPSLPAVRGHADRHTALLCAVKPYLSPARQESAETVIRLCRVWDSLERAGISLPGLLSSLGASAPPSGR